MICGAALPQMNALQHTIYDFCLCLRSLQKRRKA